MFRFYKLKEDDNEDDNACTQVIMLQYGVIRIIRSTAVDYGTYAEINAQSCLLTINYRLEGSRKLNILCTRFKQQTGTKLTHAGESVIQPQNYAEQISMNNEIFYMLRIS